MNDEHSTPMWPSHPPPPLDVNRIERILSVMRYAISKAKPYRATPTSEALAYANDFSFGSPTARMTGNMLETHRHMQDQVFFGMDYAARDSLSKSMYSRLVLDPIRVQNSKSFNEMIAAMPPPRFYTIVLDEIDLCTSPLRTVKTEPNVYQRVAGSIRGPRFNQRYVAPAPYCSPQTLYAELDRTLGASRLYRRIRGSFIPVDRFGLIESSTPTVVDELYTGEVGKIDSVTVKETQTTVVLRRTPYVKPVNALLRAIP